MTNNEEKDQLTKTDPKMRQRMKLEKGKLL